MWGWIAGVAVLVLIGFPIWYLISNDSTLLYYVPSALLGMTIGFGLPPIDVSERLATGILHFIAAWNLLNGHTLLQCASNVHAEDGTGY